MNKETMKKKPARSRGPSATNAAASKKPKKPAGLKEIPLLEREIKELKAELKRKDRALKKARERHADEARSGVATGFKTIVEGSPIPQLIIGRDHRVLSWNRALESISGIKAEEVVGTKTQWQAFYHKKRPILADLLIDGDFKSLRQWYGDKCKKSKYVADAYEGMDYFFGKDRNGIWLFFTAVLLKDSAGAVIGALETLEDVTERMRVQEALHKSEERFREIAESTEEWIWEMDASGLYTYSNSVVKDIIGYKPEEIVGKKYFYDFLIPRSREEVRKEVLHVFALKKPFKKYINHNVHKNGSTIVLETTAIPILNESGRLLGYRGADTNITERVRAEEALRKSELQFRQLVENAGEMIIVAQGELFTYVNPMTCAVTGFSEQELLARPFMEFIHPEDRGLVAERYRKRMAGEEIPPFYELRMIHKDGGFRWVELSAVRIEWNGSDATLNFLKDITERKSAEDALRKSESHYRLLAENMDDVIFVLGRDLHFSYISPSIRKLRGYEPHELLHLMPADMVTPESLVSLRQAFRQGLASIESGRDTTVKVEVEQPHKDGSTVWIEIVVNPLRDDRGVHIGFVGVGRDISERRRLNQVLRESEERYRLLVENAGEIIAVAQEGVLKYVNPKTTAVTGFSAEELCSRPMLDFIHPEDRAMVAERYQRRQASIDSPAVYEFRVLHKDGGFRWVEINAVGFSWEGSFATLNFFKDITARRRIEDALHESERRYRELVENANSIILRVDPEGTVLFFNEFAQDFFGFSSGEILGKNLVGTIIPPVDSLGNDLTGLLGKVIADPEKYKSYENENMKRSGERVWVAWTNKLVRDATGTIQEILTVGNDITWLKKAEEELLRSEIKYRELADFLPELLFELDLDGNVTYVNRVAYSVYGYSPEDIIKPINFVEVVAPADQDRCMENFRSVLAGKWITGTEYTLLRKDGTMLQAIIHGRAIIHDGAITGARGIVIDISDRKKAEDALKESEEKFRRLFEDSGTAQFLFDGDRIVDCNIEGVSILGCIDKGQVVNMNFYDFTPEFQPDGASSVDRRKDYTELALRQRSVTYEWQLRRPDGSLFNSEVVMTAIPMTGREIVHTSIRDITERKRLQNEIISIIDVEQQRLGRDLHDGLGQDLTGIAFMCTTLAKKLREAGLPEAALSDEITGEVYRIITRVRMLSRELYPPNLVENEISYTLDQFAANISSIFGIQCTYRQDPDIVISDIMISTQLYYIAREAVNNAVKHGHAGRIKLRLTHKKNEVMLVIEDDGTGRPDTFDSHKGLGLRIMAYRMATINGSFAIQDNVGGGVRIVCTFPVYKLLKKD